MVADADGDLVVATPGRRRAARPDVTGADGEPAALVLQQPGPTADPSSPPPPTGGSSPSRSTAASAAEIGQLAGTAPVAPIVFGGCVFAVCDRPATFAQWCRGGDGAWTEVQTRPLDGAGSELRLRLVNGWVWINDVDTGAAWVTSPQQRLDRVEDWGNILSDLDDESDDDNTDEDGGEVLTEVNPDDPERRDRAVRRDRRGGPEPAADRPRRRGADPGRPADRRRRAAQRHRPQRRRPRRHRGRAGRRRRGRSTSPRTAAACRCPRRPGYAGPVTFGYTITDGRDASASATVTVDVRPSDGERQPAARGAQRHRLDPPRPADDVRRARQRRRPRRRRPRARVDRPRPTPTAGAGRARARPVRPGRVHARPEHARPSASS